MHYRYFSINKGGCSIRCKLYYNDLNSICQLVLYEHGFGGNKDNKAAERFARKALSKHDDVAVLAFDWPCHGEDARKRISMEDCDRYLALVVDYVRKELGVTTLFSYATSFGGYLLLKYISEQEKPFSKIALRSAAVNMHDLLTDKVMTEKERDLLAKGKDVLVGFDRKIKLSRRFMDDLLAADISARSYDEAGGRILMIHGTKDELIPIEIVRGFAKRNRIPFVSIENADHRFVDAGKMEEATKTVMEFFWPK